MGISWRARIKSPPLSPIRFDDDFDAAIRRLLVFRFGGWDDPAGIAEASRLDAVGSDAQLLVLTCSPRRYDSVEGAHRIELTAIAP